MFAPEEAMGLAQIIPSTGAHEQFFPTKEQLQAFLVLGLIEYDPDYGPGARVYRPKMLADAEAVRTWLG